MPATPIASAACQFVGVMNDGCKVFITDQSVIVVLFNTRAGDYIACPLDECIDSRPPTSRLHQAALLYLEHGVTPEVRESGMTPTDTGASEMEETIVIRTVRTVQYIEITRTVPAPVIDVTPAPAPIAAPSAPIAAPSAPVYAVGDRVRYTSKAGRTATYTVKWVGLARDGVTQRLGLPAPRGGRLFYFNVNSNVSPA